MRQVLFPLRIPERCSLMEALRWVQFDEYPVYDYRPGFRLHRADVEYPDVDFDRDKDPLGWIPRDGEYDHEKTMQANVDFHAEFEKAKARLISGLTQGKLEPYGRLSTTPIIPLLAERGTDWWKWQWDYPPAGTPDTPIPADFWILRGVSFDSSQAQSPTGWYSNISVSTDKLLAEFPEPAPVEFPAEKRGGYIVSKLENPAPAPAPKKGGGRPEKYDWGRFYAAIAEIVHVEGIPLSQSEMENRMKDWCMAEFGDTPSDSTIRDRVQPVYSKLKPHLNLPAGKQP